ncbi:hypothetical protein IWZ00DRAFT_542195 [Phyllosticta capitalensis]
MTKRGDPLAAHSEVVDFELCTAAADLLAPSLQQHDGCNIIDVNPGTGLWSSTINNLLRPKRHVLIEDDQRFYPFVERLLQSDPSYTHVPYNGSDPQSLTRVVDEGLVPWTEISPVPTKSSTSTLILMNLTRLAGIRSTGAAVKTKDKVLRRGRILNLLREAWCRSGIQKHGPVRTLLWVDDDVKDLVVPKTVIDNNTSVISRRYASHMHVVAEDFSKTARADGGGELEWRSTWQAMKRMEAAGLKIPEQRQNLLHKTLLRLGEDWPRTWERIRQTKYKDFDQLDVPAGKKFYHRHRINNQPYLNEAREVRRLERLAVDDSVPEEARVAAREEYEKRSSQLSRAVASFNKGQALTFHQDADREILMNRDPPGLVWDRRPFEPIDCTKKDFYLPKLLSDNGMVLLDLCASRPTQEQNMSDMIYWERVVSRIMECGTESPATRFNRISPGAAEQLMPKLSALYDPLRHGTLNPEYFRTRLVTYEMLDEMVAALRSWPSLPRHIHEALVAPEWLD